MTCDSGETLLETSVQHDVLPQDISSASSSESPEQFGSPDSQLSADLKKLSVSPSSSPSKGWFATAAIIDINEAYRRREDDDAEREKQDALMEEFSEIVEAEGWTMEGVLESTKLRFLVARNFNVQKAAAFYVAHRKWRQSFIPADLGHIPESDLPTFPGSDFGGFQFIPGFAPLLILKPKHHSPDFRSVEETAKFSVYGLDKAVGCLPPNEHKFVVIFDLADLAYRNLDTRAAISVLHILQNQYPERLRRVFMVHVPYIFWAAYRIVYPFIDPVTRQKIVFVEDKNLESALLEVVPRQLLPKEYGGEMEFVRTLDAPLVAWPHPYE